MMLLKRRRHMSAVRRAVFVLFYFFPKVALNQKKLKEDKWRHGGKYMNEVGR